MRSTMPDKCVRCGCGVVSGTVHRQAGHEQRSEWKRAGIRRYGCRGLCSTCVVYLRAHGGLDAYQLQRWAPVRDTAGDAQPHPGEPICRRCGIDCTIPSRLCDDCVAVLHDLGELETWLVPA